MNPEIVSMISDYMTKTGSYSAEARSLLGRYDNLVNKQDMAKTASVAAHRETAEKLAFRLSEDTLPSDASFIGGKDMIKHATAMLNDHGDALEVLNLVLNAVKLDQQKTASIEPGRPATSGKTASATGKDALSTLIADLNIV